mmetsp:Transcript_24414/g.40390  ORF Transcript_24414/g.40390 Transcript_24414/m.40390 type:complete len:103 (-) Transcript_24414:28-336(-)
MGWLRRPFTRKKTTRRKKVEECFEKNLRSPEEEQGSSPGKVMEPTLFSSPSMACCCSSTTTCITYKKYLLYFIEGVYYSKLGSKQAQEGCTENAIRRGVDRT